MMLQQGLPLSCPILCKEGWKTVHQIEVGEKILSLNPRTFSFLYSTVSKIHFAQNVKGLRVIDKTNNSTLLECSTEQLWWIAQEYANLRNIFTTTIQPHAGQYLFTRIEWGFSSEKAIWVSECFFLDLQKFEIEEIIISEVWYPQVDTGLWFTRFADVDLCLTKSI